MAVGRRPAIYVRRPPGSQDLAKELGVSVLEWGQISRMKGRGGHSRRAEAGERVRGNPNPNPNPTAVGSRARLAGVALHFDAAADSGSSACALCFATFL